MTSEHPVPISSDLQQVAQHVLDIVLGDPEVDGVSLKLAAQHCRSTFPDIFEDVIGEAAVRAYVDIFENSVVTNVFWEVKTAVIVNLMARAMSEMRHF